VLQDYIHAVEDSEARRDRLTRQIEEVLPSWSMVTTAIGDRPHRPARSRLIEVCLLLRAPNDLCTFLGVSRLLGTCVTLRKDRTQVIPFVIRQNDDCACERPPLFESFAGYYFAVLATHPAVL
jgi:hypothetical protein